MNKHFLILILNLSLFSISLAQTNEQNHSWYFDFLDGIGKNTISSFTGYNSLLHLSAFGATWGIIESDIDYKTQDFFSKRPGLSYAFLPVAITGAIGPLALGIPLYIRGHNNSNSKLMGAGSAVLQSTIISFSYISLLKAITGRPHPDTEKYSDIKSLSREFDFGFGKKGIFWGWPSGHTGVTSAVLSSMMSYYPDKKWIQYGSITMILYTAIGVSGVNKGQMHWLSDGVAGMLTGYAIGTSVGKYFRNKQIKENEKTKVRITFKPYLNGLICNYTF